MTTLRPAATVALAGLAVIGGGDVWLIRHGHRPVTDAARTVTGWCVIGVIVGHFAHLLGPLDPFSAIARRITPQETT